MTGKTTAATGAMTGKTTAATGAMTGKTTAATGAMTGKTGVVAALGCSGNRELDDHGQPRCRTGLRCSCGAAATAFVADLLAPEAAASVLTGTVRVVLALPCWDDCLHTGLDDLIESASQSPWSCCRRVRRAVRAPVGVAVKHSPAGTPAPLDS
jgi:hypothetical protein